MISFLTYSDAGFQNIILFFRLLSEMIAKVSPIYHHHHLFAHKSTTIRTSNRTSEPEPSGTASLTRALAAAVKITNSI